MIVTDKVENSKSYRMEIPFVAYDDKQAMEYMLEVSGILKILFKNKTPDRFLVCDYDGNIINPEFRDG